MTTTEKIILAAIVTIAAITVYGFVTGWQKCDNEITELKIQKTQLQTELANIRGAT